MNEVATRTRYRVEGMDCAACAAKIDTAVRRLPGVVDVSVSVSAATMVVQHDGDVLADVERQVTRLGYGLAALEAAGPVVALEDDGAEPAPMAPSWWRGRKATVVLACAGALAAAFVASFVLPEAAPWAFAAAMLVGLGPIARRALLAARAGTPFSIETLMVVAAVGAVAIGAVEEAAAVVLLFLIGEMLEGVAAGRARASIQSLAALVPRTALVERGDALHEVAAARLVVGATILVRPGDRIAADGVVLDGDSAVDEAPVSGESVPVAKAAGDTVFAGTVNGAAALRVRVTAAAADNTIARIVRLVEEAQDSRAPTERLIDRFARWYTPSVMVLAALVAVLPPLVFGGDWNGWIYKGLALLLIGCPCALVISTPAAIAAGLSAGARRGLLVKGGAVLERLGDVTVVAFDKTGTLTRGRPEVTDVFAFALPAGEVLRLAAGLEAGSSHPLAAAILASAAEDRLVVPRTEGAVAIAGLGVAGTIEGRALFLGAPAAALARGEASAEVRETIDGLAGNGRSLAVLVADGVMAGAIALRDAPREDAKAGLAALAAAGIGRVMLTGDNAAAAEAMGARLGIAVRAGLLPADKLAVVRELQAGGAVVAKVGDGINDAPALAAADVGIAMGGGTDVALETADAAVLHGRVADVAAMIALSRQVMANIRQNIAIALGLKALFLVTTVAGITGLWPAILADTGATVLVTLNALRLLGRK
ncbi:MAG: cadmium-translocating P-type ATPase [Acetobacteraceae bacterium]|nr:cadmium-translocating P-type ATPase [Acetobacteraceae bacterium]